GAGAMARGSGARGRAGGGPAASKVASRPPGATLPARLLVRSAGQAPRCGTSTSGQTQPMSSGFTDRAAGFLGQNGRNVRATSSPVPEPVSWAASGYAPNVRMPTRVTLIVSDQDWVACAGTRDGRVSSAPGTGAASGASSCPAR